MAAFRDKGIINDENRIADWERQGVTNAERQRDYRARRRLAEDARLSRTTENAKKHRFPVNETDPDSDAETAARRKRLGALAVTKSNSRIQGTEETGR